MSYQIMKLSRKESEYKRTESRKRDESMWEWRKNVDECAKMDHENETGNKICIACDMPVQKEAFPFQPNRTKILR